MAIINGNDLANDLSGTDAADSIYGFGGNDTLRGTYRNPLGGGIDYLYGGLGDDEYDFDASGFHGSQLKLKVAIVDEGGEADVINLKYTPGVDPYLMSWLAPDNVEFINVYGAVLDTHGNDVDNEIHVYYSGLAPNAIASTSIFGGGGDDVIFGSDYGEFISGGTGVDGMAGGKGDDTYEVDDVNDLIIENSNGGIDGVDCYASQYRLSSNVENLNIFSAGLNYTGNRSDNFIESFGDYSRVIKAGAGSDTVVMTGNADDLIIGGAGNDSLNAGLGDDVYRTSLDFGHDTITDTGGFDTVEFDVNPDQLWFVRGGNDLNVSVIGTQNIVTIKNYYSDANAKIEEFDAGNGKVLTGASIDTLVSAMAMFAPPTTTTMPQSTHDALAWTLSSTWQ
jgi:Ca2+-binding RTX toxin-like protein